MFHLSLTTTFQTWQHITSISTSYTLSHVVIETRCFQTVFYQIKSAHHIAQQNFNYQN